MEKDLFDDIEILDDIEIVDEIEELSLKEDEIVDLLSDFSSSENKEAVYSGDLGLEIEKPIEVVKAVETPIIVPIIEVPEEVVVEDIMSKTYNLAEVVKVANEEIVEEKDEFDGRQSAIFIGVLFVILVIFVLALPYITKLMVE